jgi:hypothetical protein
MGRFTTVNRLMMDEASLAQPRRVVFARTTR